MLHLIEFDEPFGLSVVESMASGTPVIAMNRGSMPEIVTPRVTGMLVTTLDEAVSAVSAVGDLDREAIAADTARRFDVARMVDDYLAVYRSVLSEQSARNLPRQPGAIPESPRDLRHV